MKTYECFIYPKDISTVYYYFQISDPPIQEDYISPRSFSISLPYSKKNIDQEEAFAEGNIIYFKGEYPFIGTIINVQKKEVDSIAEIEIISIHSIFDMNYAFKCDTIDSNFTLEREIFNFLDNYGYDRKYDLTTGDDPYQAIKFSSRSNSELTNLVTYPYPLGIIEDLNAVSGRTSGGGPFYYPIEQPIVNILTDVVVPSLAKYSVYVFFTMHDNGYASEMTTLNSEGYIKPHVRKISEADKDILEIDADALGVIIDDWSLNVPGSSTNKLYFFFPQNSNVADVLYLHPDGSFDAVNNNRILPVRVDSVTGDDYNAIDEQSGSTWNEKAHNWFLQKAEEVFSKASWSSQIELTIPSLDFIEYSTPTSAQNKPFHLGMACNIYRDGEVYSTNLTGIAFDDDGIHLSFGLVRTELTQTVQRR